MIDPAALETIVAAEGIASVIAAAAAVLPNPNVTSVGTATDNPAGVTSASNPTENPVGAAAVGNITAAAIGNIAAAAVGNTNAAAVGNIAAASIGNIAAASVSNIAAASVGNIAAAAIGNIAANDNIAAIDPPALPVFDFGRINHNVAAPPQRMHLYQKTWLMCFDMKLKAFMA